MVKIMENEKENGNDTGLVAGAGFSFDINRMTETEKLELQRAIWAADKALVYASLPIKKSNSILGVPLTIVDARLSTIPEYNKKTQETIDKPVVNFLVINQDTNERFSVTKAANVFNMAFVDYFEARRGIAEQPLQNYSFLEDSNFGTSENDAIVLRVIQTQVSAKPATK